MSDFLNNLIASVQNPGEAIQPRLGPIYGEPPVNFLQATGEAALDFATEVDSPAGGEPFIDTPPSLEPDDNTPAKLPEPARSVALPGEAEAPGRNDSFTRPQMDLRSMPEKSSLPAPTVQYAPSMKRPFAEPLLQARAESDGQDKQPAVSSISAEGKTTPLSRQTTMPPQLLRSMMMPLTPAPKIIPEQESVSSTAQNAVPNTGDRAKPSPVGFQPGKNKERPGLRESLRLSEAAAIVFSSPAPPFSVLGPRSVLPQDLTPAITPQNVKSAPSPVSTIRVNIGRIEVRAVMPSVASPPIRKRSSPQMSLEEYLKQRNGERR